MIEITQGAKYLRSREFDCMFGCRFDDFFCDCVGRGEFLFAFTAKSAVLDWNKLWCDVSEIYTNGIISN